MQNKTLAERLVDEFIGDKVTTEGWKQLVYKIRDWLSQQPESKQPTWELTKILARLESEGLPMPNYVHNNSKMVDVAWCESPNILVVDEDGKIYIIGSDHKRKEQKLIDDAIAELKKLLEVGDEG